MDKDFLGRLLKNTNNRILYVILIIGIVLMLFTQYRPKEPQKEEVRTSEQEELSRIISGIDGAGRAQVMVTYYGTGTSRIVYDTKTRGDQTDRTAVVSGGEAIIAGESYPRVKGVVVVAEGAGSDAVCESIREAVMVALDVPEYKVSVLRGR